MVENVAARAGDAKTSAIAPAAMRITPDDAAQARKDRSTVSSLRSGGGGAAPEAPPGLEGEQDRGNGAGDPADRKAVLAGRSGWRGVHHGRRLDRSRRRFEAGAASATGTVGRWVPVFRPDAWYFVGEENVSLPSNWA
ncbi:hypothetical protein [Paractinoplanes durhamensis]|uniref:hypothetical protein n=1 Tax=Paractinoplanes durhamensis TaxID=113563 RepID=UPI0036334C3C